MWASGNGGGNGDSCAADGYASSMYTIAVGSADEKGYQATYDERCAGKLAVTYSFNLASYSTSYTNVKGQVVMKSRCRVNNLLYTIYSHQQCHINSVQSHFWVQVLLLH